MIVKAFCHFALFVFYLYFESRLFFRTGIILIVQLISGVAQLCLPSAQKSYREFWGNFLLLCRRYRHGVRGFIRDAILSMLIRRGERDGGFWGFVVGYFKMDLDWLISPRGYRNTASILGLSGKDQSVQRFTVFRWFEKWKGLCFNEKCSGLRFFKGNILVKFIRDFYRL